MMSVQKEGVDFVLQVICSKFLRDDGTSAGATVFTAFAAKDKIDNSRCLIQVHSGMFKIQKNIILVIKTI